MSKPIAAGARIGHVHLRVADLERALGFYCGVLLKIQGRCGVSFNKFHFMIQQLRFQRATFEFEVGPLERKPGMQ